MPLPTAIAYCHCLPSNKRKSQTHAGTKEQRQCLKLHSGDNSKHDYTRSPTQELKQEALLHVDRRQDIFHCLADIQQDEAMSLSSVAWLPMGCAKADPLLQPSVPGYEGLNIHTPPFHRVGLSSAAVKSKRRVASKPYSHWHQCGIRREGPAAPCFATENCGRMGQGRDGRWSDGRGWGGLVGVGCGGAGWGSVCQGKAGWWHRVGWVGMQTGERDVVCGWMVSWVDGMVELNLKSGLARS